MLNYCNYGESQPISWFMSQIFKNVSSKAQYTSYNTNPQTSIVLTKKSSLEAKGSLSKVEHFSDLPLLRSPSIQRANFPLADPTTNDSALDFKK